MANKCIYDIGGSPCGAKTLGMSQFCSAHTSQAESELTFDTGIPSKRSDADWGPDESHLPAGHDENK